MYTLNFLSLKIIFVAFFFYLALFDMNAQNKFKESKVLDQQIKNICISEKGDIVYFVLFRDTTIERVRHFVESLQFLSGKTIRLPKLQHIAFFDENHIFAIEPHYDTGKTIIKYAIRNETLHRIGDYECSYYDRPIDIMKLSGKYRVFIHGTGEAGYGKNILLDEHLKEISVYEPNGENGFDDELFGVSNHNIITFTARDFRKGEYIGHVIDGITGVVKSESNVNLGGGLYKKIYCGEENHLIYTNNLGKTVLFMVDTALRLSYSKIEEPSLMPEYAGYSKIRKSFLFSVKNSHIKQIRESSKYAAFDLSIEAQILSGEFINLMPISNNPIVMIVNQAKNKRNLYHLNLKNKLMYLAQIPNEEQSLIRTTKRGIYIIQKNKYEYYEY